jgi:protein TonB
MRRLRQTSAGLSPATFGRLCAAVACSAALHVFLIYGWSLPAGSARLARPGVMHARLVAPPPDARGATPPVRRLPVTVHAVAPLPFAAGVPAPSSIPPRSAEGTTDPDPDAPAQAGATTAVDIADLVHHAAQDLDVYPRALQPIVPPYPQAAHAARVGGFVTLRVTIDAGGRVVEASVVDAAPEGVFEQVAQQKMAETAFFPAQRNGRSVRCRVLVRIDFDPDDVPSGP